MKNYYFGMLILLNILFFHGMLYSQNTVDTLYFEDNTPVTVSLSNKTINNWQLDPEINKGLEIINIRNGYLFTYFTFMIKDPSIERVVFQYTDNNNLLERPFLVKPLSTTNPPLQQEMYGDIPSITQSEGFLSQANQFNANNNITPSTNEVPQENTNLSPEDINKAKKYIQSLIDNNLYTQAREAFNTLNKNNIDSAWYILTDFRIDNFLKNYQNIVDKSDSLIKENKEPKELLLKIHIEKAKALENLNNMDDAQKEFLYLKSYFSEYPESYMQLADFYIRNENYQQALVELNYIASSFRNYPNLDKIYYQLGHSYYKSMGVNGYSLALNNYKKVLGFGISSPYYSKSKQLVDFLEKDLLHYH